MYLAVQEVLELELKHLYTCSPAAVGQQAYATAILYNILRTSQARIAATAGIAPEILSVERLFPTLIDHYIQATSFAFGSEFERERVHAAHPRITRPEALLDPPWLRVRIRDHLLEKRKEECKKRRFCVGRARATSYNLIPGAKKLRQDQLSGNGLEVDGCHRSRRELRPQTADCVRQVRDIRSSRVAKVVKEDEPGERPDTSEAPPRGQAGRCAAPGAGD